MKKIIITCAVNGPQPARIDTIKKPMTSKEIAAEVVQCAKAGAAICHIHALDAEGKPTNDPAIWREIDREVRTVLSEADEDVILNYSTQCGTGEARYAHVLELRPEMASFPCGSVNWEGDRPFLNGPVFLRKMGAAFLSAGVKPEIEIYDGEMIKWAERFFADGVLKAPMHFQLTLGTYGGADASVGNLLFLQRKIPGDATYSVSGIGEASIPMLMAALAMEADGVRVGLEDVPEVGNVAQIERVKGFLKALNLELATVADARAILGLGKEIL